MSLVNCIGPTPDFLKEQPFVAQVNLEGNGFGFNLALTGFYLQFTCYATPEELKAKNFVNRHYLHQLESGRMFKISSRSNPSIHNLHHIYVQGSYDDLALKPFILDLRKELQGQPEPIKYADALACFEEFASDLKQAIQGFDPSKIQQGARMEAQDGSKSHVTKRATLLAPLNAPVKVSPDQMLTFNLKKVLNLKKGFHTITFGAILRDVFIKQIREEQEKAPDQYGIQTLRQFLCLHYSKAKNPRHNPETLVVILDHELLTSQAEGGNPAVSLSDVLDLLRAQLTDCFLTPPIVTGKQIGRAHV